MTVQDLGSIGELVAAIATVATLGYLAVQIRANTTALRIESRRAEMVTSVPILSPIIEDPEVAKMFLAGLADFGSLSPEDNMRFSLLLGLHVGAEAAHFDEVMLGLSPRESLKRRKETLAVFLATPGGRAFWAQFSSQYADEFRDYVETEVLAGRPA